MITYGNHIKSDGTHRPANQSSGLSPGRIDLRLFAYVAVVVVACIATEAGR